MPSTQPCGGGEMSNKHTVGSVIPASGNRVDEYFAKNVHHKMHKVRVRADGCDGCKHEKNETVRCCSCDRFYKTPLPDLYERG